MDLTMLLKGASNPTSWRARMMLGMFKDNGLRSWINSILFDEAALGQLTARSVWHPNGFLKIVVAQGGGGERIRLHIWPQDGRANRGEDIHDHYWSFSSLVLLGRLETASYKRIEREPSEPFSIKELSDFRRDIKAGRAYEFRDGGMTCLFQILRRQLKKGEVYWMTPYEIHRVRKIGRGTTATLVLQGPPTRSKTRVFVQLHQNSKNQIGTLQRAALRSEVVALLAQLSQLLSVSAGAA